MTDRWIDVEKELSIAIKAMGGMRVDEMIGKNSTHKNADFIFNENLVVAELKSLEKDQISDESFINKVSKIYERELASKATSPLIYGRQRITTDGFSDEFRRKIADLYRFPIARRIRDADRQISETKIRLGLNNQWNGVLILVNDGNTALDPRHIIWSLAETIKGSNFSSIQHVIFFTVNMLTKHPEINIPLNFWYSAGANGNRLQKKFEEDLRLCWFSHLSSIFGEVAEISGTDELLEDLTNIQKP
ncbi:MAG: hypothetical protein V4673_17390 [Pseudomonadota bacterium]